MLHKKQISYTKVHSTPNHSSENQGWILSAEQMEVLRTKPYIYNATAGSVLELLFLQRFWTWLVKYIPIWIAPCVLTCSGLIITLSSSLTLIYYSPDARDEAPSWIFFFCGIGLFLYQTLDALDGKQAIKIQNSQIEEVYDHGCDAVSTIFVTLAVSIALQLGNHPALMFLFCISSLVGFYSTHWQDHITHVMVFGKIDVSEGQWVVILIHLLTGYFGQNFWQINIAIQGLQARYIIWTLTMLSILKAIFNNFQLILGKHTPVDAYATIQRKTGSHIWYPAVSLFLTTLFAIKAYMAGLFNVCPTVFLVAFGFVYAKLTIKLVMANVTSADMDFWDSSLIAPLLLFLNTILRVLPCYTALLCCLVYNIMDFARYFTYASWDMREALDLFIFSLKHPLGSTKCRNGNLGVYLNGLNNSEFKTPNNKNEH